MENRNIKVLRITNRFNLGGPTYNVAYLSKYLDAPYETKLIGGMKDESEASSEYILDQIGVEREVITEMRRSINPFQDIIAYRKIRSIIREYKPDIVHTHAAKSGTLGRLAAIHEKVPIVLHTFHGHVFHSYFGTFKTSIFKTIERWLAKNSSGVVCISDEQAREISEEHRICERKKTRVIPLGFNLDRFTTDQDQKRKKFRSIYNLNESDIAIGIVGRLVPIKNHALFVDMIQEIMKQTEGKKCRFFIIGDGESRESIEQYCTEKGIGFTQNKAPEADHPLCFTSWIKEVDEVYAGLDIVCLTSNNEGTPVSLIEALAASKPVVSTRVGGIEDIVENGNSGLLSEPGDRVAFSENVLNLIKRSDLRQSFGEKGKTSVLEKYSYKRLVKDMKVFYDQLISER